MYYWFFLKSMVKEIRNQIQHITSLSTVTMVKQKSLQ